MRFEFSSAERRQRSPRRHQREPQAEERIREPVDGALRRALRFAERCLAHDQAELQQLVPKPRKHLVTYHGVLAPASGLRSRVVPRRVEEEGEAGGCRHGAGSGGEGEHAVRFTVPITAGGTDATVRGMLQ